jgi:pyruvate/2-oxoglutarate dehydrogenase complex dihydrolipoamide dehydrogenase (E3) component
VIEALAPLAKDDHELRSLVIQKLMEEGVRILAPAAIRKVTKSAEGIRVEIEQHDIVSGSHILVAAGRLANVEGLGLEAAGVFFTPKGIRVDAALRSSQKHIYAVGDVAGGPQFTHVANYHAGLVIRSILFRLPVKNRADTIPRVTYTDPELASAGLSEAEARQKFGNSVRVMRSPFLENDRAQTEGKPQGLVKAIIGRRGRILGVAIAGQQAGELIQPWVLAMGNGLKVQALAAMVVPYPTLGEASRQASVNYFSGLATSPWVRRAIKLMSFLG